MAGTRTGGVMNASRIVAFIFFLALGTRGAAAPAATEDRSVDEDAIKGVLAEYVRTWNRHDVDAWGRLFTDDVQYVNRAGEVWRSTEENVEGHRAVHETLSRQNQKMDYQAAVEGVRFLKPDIALVHATWRWPGFVGPSGEPRRDFRGVMSTVMVKRDGRWLIRALHNTVTEPPPSPQQAAGRSGDGPGATPQAVRHVSVSIKRPPEEVYAFASNPANLPKWAAGLGGSIRQAGGEWVADGPMGSVKVRFAAPNALGVLDHDVTLPSGVTIHNPMRVVRRGQGSEVVFTLFRRPEVTDEEFAKDAGMVEKDLKTLRQLLER